MNTEFIFAGVRADDHFAIPSSALVRRPAGLGRIAVKKVYGQGLSQAGLPAWLAGLSLRVAITAVNRP
jgi:hypothetical protein